MVLGPYLFIYHYLDTGPIGELERDISVRLLIIELANKGRQQTLAL